MNKFLLLPISLILFHSAFAEDLEKPNTQNVSNIFDNAKYSQEKDSKHQKIKRLRQKRSSIAQKKNIESSPQGASASMQHSKKQSEENSSEKLPMKKKTFTVKPVPRITPSNSPQNLTENKQHSIKPEEKEEFLVEQDATSIFFKGPQESISMATDKNLSVKAQKLSDKARVLTEKAQALFNKAQILTEKAKVFAEKAHALNKMAQISEKNLMVPSSDLKENKNIPAFPIEGSSSRLDENTYSMQQDQSPFIAQQNTDQQQTIPQGQTEEETQVSNPPKSSPEKSLENKPPLQAKKKQRVNEIQPTVELKVGYFFFSDPKMRKVYKEGGLDLQLSGSYPLWKWFQIYGSIESMERHWKSINGRQKTRIWEYPISLGVKTVVTVVPKVQYYLTLGPRYFFVHVHNNSPYVDRKLNQNSLGGFIGTGFNFLPLHHFLIDVFGEYSYDRMSFHSSKRNSYGETTQVGGFTFGAGLGYAF